LEGGRGSLTVAVHGPEPSLPLRACLVISLGRWEVLFLLPYPIPPWNYTAKFNAIFISSILIKKKKNLGLLERGKKENYNKLQVAGREGR
jgi:hypothetical protein